MGRYRFCWTVATTASGGAGLGALGGLHSLVLVALAPLLMVIGIVVALVSDPESVPARSRLHRVGSPVLFTTLVLCAVAGAGAVFGLVGGVMASALVIICPTSIRSAGRMLRAVGPPTGARFDALLLALARADPTCGGFDTGHGLSGLTDDELVRAWQESQSAVLRPSTRRSLVRTVEERGRYLAELERRRPGVLVAWLASGAFTINALATDPGERAPVHIDWDELTRGKENER